MINFKIILNVLGFLLISLSGILTIPLLCDLIIQNETWKSFLISLVISFSFGLTLVLSTRGDRETKVTMQDTFLLTTLSWIVICIFGALPFYLSPFNFSLTDSIFESMSGVTTTGSTIVDNVEILSQGLLLWRSLLQWVGGVGIIVMAISILPVLQVGGMQVFRTESSDNAEKILPRTAQIAMAVIIIYLILTSLCAISYWLFGMSFFDSIAHSMTTIATGGFSTKNNSLASFNSNSLEYISCLFTVSYTHLRAHET